MSKTNELIVTVPSPILANPTKPVTEFNQHLNKIITRMKTALNQAVKPRGVGLAAPQIGEPWRIFLIKPTVKSAVGVFINPEILERADAVTANPPKEDKRLEGCLSIPGIWGMVNRADWVKLSFMDENGQTSSLVLSGFPATIAQHEIDHLNGILFTQRVLEQQGRLFQTKFTPNGKENLEELSLA